MCFEEENGEMNQSELSIATIRSLGIDMINKANSGHPGMVLGYAPALYTLFTKELKVFPKESDWFNRDRFVLASGHASSLLYSLLQDVYKRQVHYWCLCCSLFWCSLDFFTC